MVVVVVVVVVVSKYLSLQSFFHAQAIMVHVNFTEWPAPRVLGGRLVLAD